MLLKVGRKGVTIQTCSRKQINTCKAVDDL